MSWTHPEEIRSASPTDQGPGRLADLEPQDRLADRLRQRAHRPAADLHHGSRRHQPAASHRPGLCGFSQLVAQWTVSGFLLDAQVRARGTGCQRLYLMDVASKQWVQLTHDCGTQRFSLLVAGRAAHCLSIPPHRQRPDLDHAGRRHECEAVNVQGRQHAAQLELEVN